jgi:hypothetical protein
MALLAAASPLALTLTIAVLKTRLARLNGVIFAVGFLLGETIGWILALALGAAANVGDGDDVVAGVLELALGALLLAAAWRVHRGAVPQPRGGTGRTRALLARFEHLTPVTAAVMGTLFGLGIPKRLTITLVAAATLTAADLSRPEEVSLVVLYIAVAGVLVWAPVAVYVVAGHHASAMLDAGQRWLTANQQPVATATLLVFGGILATDGLVATLS